VWILV